MLLSLTASIEQIALDPAQFLGIPLALAGAACLSIGAQFQHGGVSNTGKQRIGESQIASTLPGETLPSSKELRKSLSSKQLLLLLTRPVWLIGGLFLVLAIILQLSSLSVAPIIVVQPIGAIALVITAILNSRLTKVRLNKMSILAITLCVGGIFVFVGIAAFTAVEHEVTELQLVIILSTLLVVLVLAILVLTKLGRKLGAVTYVLMAGVLFGFVATLAKVFLERFTSGTVDPFAICCLIGLVLATVLGSYFVQNAYASGPPDLVIAGLTVIDPLIAVSVGIIVLGEANQAPDWAGGAFLIAGTIAVAGVFLLAKFHPQKK